MTSWDSTENGWREVIMGAQGPLLAPLPFSKLFGDVKQEVCKWVSALHKSRGWQTRNCRPNLAHRANPFPTDFANKVLLAFSHAHLFEYCLRLLLHHNTRVKLCNRPHRAAKLKIFTIWPLQKKFAESCAGALSSYTLGRGHVDLACSHSMTWVPLPTPFPSSPNTWYNKKGKGWFLTSILGLLCLLNVIRTCTFIKCVAFSRSSLKKLHT